jgi:hypothetical protein
VNVVLKRDYRGVDLTATSGISTRSDARRLVLEGRVGFTPDGGRTDVMVYLNSANSQPLRAGQRRFNARNIAAGYRAYLTQLPDTAPPAASNFPGGSATTIYSADLDLATFGAAPLSFKPQYGGAALGSPYTFLPSAFSGGTTALVAALTGA